MDTLPLENNTLCPRLIERVRVRQAEILDWLRRHEIANELPLYSSVDIRNAGFKTAVVDTNLFPAGFNNLCEHGLADSVRFIRQAVLGRVPGCRDILIIAEEHTRNAWYLENIRILQSVITQAGFNARIATFLSVQPSFCEQASFVELETATGEPVRIYCFKKLLAAIAAGRARFDLIIMNNDLTGGIPDALRQAAIPIYPSIQAGWHSRHKSCHFRLTNELIREFAAIVDLDPWFFSCLFATSGRMDINLEDDRRRLRDIAAGLFQQIADKYQEHRVTDKPYLVIKADAGTYGMGVRTIEDPDEILQLNRKSRNKLHVGKGSQVITQYLLQEGVPTIDNVDQQAGEAVIYQIENNLIGGFYRVHADKGSRENLNSKGMTFEKMCPHLPRYGECGVHHDINIFDIYRILARIAAIAAHREIVHLEANPV